MTAKRAFLFLCVCSAATVAAQQTPVRDGGQLSRTGTGLIAGTVRTADQAAAPVRRAQVDLSSAGNAISTQAITDDAGNFAFPNLPPGRYTLAVFKNGFVNMWYGAARPAESISATSIALANGQQLTGLAIKMFRGAVITGRTTDQNGQPAARATVNVLQARFDFQTGAKRFQQTHSAESDERGVYRVYGLAPGEYQVSASSTDDRVDFRLPTSAEWRWVDQQLAASASPGLSQPAAAAPPEPGRTMAYAPVYYPGTPVQSNAAIVTLGPAEERSGIDIRLDMVPTAKAVGTMNVPPGVKADGVFVNVSRLGAGAPTFVSSPQTDKDGLFTVSALPPGSYVVAARSGPAAEPGKPAPPATAWGITELTVNGKDQNVSLDLQPGLPISGRVVFDGTTRQPPADLTRVRLTLSAVLAGAPVIVPPPLQFPFTFARADGQFLFADVAPGRYRFAGNIQATAGWLLKSVMVGAVDAVDTPIDIAAGQGIEAVVTFTDHPAELAGSLQDASGRPAADYFIILFSADEAHWYPQSRRTRAVRPGIDGKYQVPNLPPGDYLITAVTEVEPQQWFDRSFLAELRGKAIRLQFAEGQKMMQDFRLGGG